MHEYLIAGAIGLFAGVIGGVFGIGGGIVMIPALVILLGYPQHLAQGTTLAAMIPPTGLLAAWVYHQKGFVNIPIAICIAIAFIFGGFFGGKIALAINPTYLKKAFSIFLGLVAIKIFTGK